MLLLCFLFTLSLSALSGKSIDLHRCGTFSTALKEEAIKPHRDRKKIIIMNRINNIRKNNCNMVKECDNFKEDYVYYNISVCSGDLFKNYKKIYLTDLTLIRWIVVCYQKMNTYHTIPSAPNGAINYFRPQHLINILGGFI